MPSPYLIRPLGSPSPARLPVEVVERKGLGHPDTMCDAIAELVGIRLCQAYREAFGRILHHNVDKVLLVAGASHPEFGGGTLLEPIELYLAGRATASYAGRTIPVSEIAIDAAREWLQVNLPALDTNRDVRIVSRIREGSAELKSLFARGEPARALANDSSCGVGFAPQTDLERIVLAAERALNAPGTKQDHPALGCDVKVMGIRRGAQVDLTVACAMVARHIPDVAAYVQSKEAARAVVLSSARRASTLPVAVHVNAGDDLDRGAVYLTVTGTSAEAGDDGEVGRGNRANGLITPYRPMTMEAAAGKNPMTHVGKLYNIVANRIAQSIVDRTGVSDAVCVLVSRIGAPIEEPQLADIQVDSKTVASDAGARATIEQIVRQQCGELAVLCDELLAGKVPVF